MDFTLFTGRFSRLRAHLPVLCFTVLCASLGCWAMFVQAQVSVPAPQFPQNPSAHRPGGSLGEPEGFPGLEHSRQVAREKERQRRMVDDANRLVALSSQYREAVQKHGTPTPEDARLLNEMERLARSVKDRMRGM